MFAAIVALTMPLLAGQLPPREPIESLGVPVQNPQYHRNTIFSASEDLNSPRLRSVREEYKLGEVVRGEADEFQRILLLRHWLHQHVVVDGTKPAVSGDALRMLAESPKGGKYHCSHFMKMQNAVLNAMGYVTRCIFAAAGEEKPPLSGAHGINEVWVNSLAKWVMLDAELDSHFEKNGLPLSALELRAEVLKDGAAQVFRHRGPERTRLAREKDDSYGHTPRTFTWVAWYPESNVHTIWPKKTSSREFVYDDPYWETHTWYRGGKKHWAYDAGYFVPIKDKHKIYWTPNTLAVNAQITGDTARINIESDTPNLKEYQMKGADGVWQRVEQRFTLKLDQPREERWFRSVNLAGVTGPEYRLVIQLR